MTITTVLMVTLTKKFHDTIVAVRRVTLIDRFRGTITSWQFSIRCSPTYDIDGNLEPGCGVDSSQGAGRTPHVCPHRVHVGWRLQWDATTETTSGWELTHSCNIDTLGPPRFNPLCLEWLTLVKDPFTCNSCPWIIECNCSSWAQFCVNWLSIAIHGLKTARSF